MRTLLKEGAKRTVYRVFEYCIRRAAKDIRLWQQIEALRDSADFAREHLAHSRDFRDYLELMDFALLQVRIDGAYVECGVFHGESLNYIARKKRDTTIHGFDSFEGLPEDWRPGYKRGVFRIADAGKLAFEPNVTIHRGWFSDTLPVFAKNLAQNVAFLHVDSDLYSSAADIFAFLGDRIGQGTVILFDEYYNYPRWREHEHRAFHEFLAGSGKVSLHRASHGERAGRCGH